MKVAIITTGDEVISGQVQDSNASWISDQCWQLGARVVWRMTVADVLKDIGEACLLAAQKADVVFVTGGLGPTSDDVTLEAAAIAFGKALEFHEEVYKDLSHFFKKVGRVMSPSNKKQAYFPAGSEALPNKIGTAAACQTNFGEALFFFLPGPPQELQPIMNEIILPRLRGKLLGNQSFIEKHFQTFGCSEAALNEKLKTIDFGDVRLSYRFTFPQIALKLACWGKEESTVLQGIKTAEKLLRGEVGEFIYAEGQTDLVACIGKLLRAHKKTLSLAESCTGGFIANEITHVPGASDYFFGGLNCYSNRSKHELLGVAKEVLNFFGAVSEESAKVLAEGVRQRFHSDYALSVTGIAGPDGGTKEKPVGTVYIGLATPEKTEVKRFYFPRERLAFKQLVSCTALDWLRRELLKECVEK